MRQVDVTKKGAELFSNLPQKLVSSFKISEIRAQMAILRHYKILSVGFRSIDCHGPIKTLFDTVRSYAVERRKGKMGG
jgi:hypothetical protein